MSQYQYNTQKTIQHNSNRKLQIRIEWNFYQDTIYMLCHTMINYLEKKKCSSPFMGGTKRFSIFAFFVAFWLPFPHFLANLDYVLNLWDEFYLAMKKLYYDEMKLIFLWRHNAISKNFHNQVEFISEIPYILCLSDHTTVFLDQAIKENYFLLIDWSWKSP